MEKPESSGVLLLRDMAEEGWRSMDRYADNLSAALKSFPGPPSFSFTTYTCRKTNFIRPLRPLLKWLPYVGDYLTDLYFSRFLKYPWLAENISKKFAVSHVLDHSYAHLLYWLKSPLKVVTCHDLIPLSFDQDKTNRRLFQYSVRGLKRADLILADSQATRHDLEDKLGISRRRIRVIPLAVDLSKFHPIANREELDSVRRRYQLPSEKIVLHVGNSLVYKNQERILQALALLRQTAPEPFYFLKIGSLSESQHRLVEHLQLGDRLLERSMVPDEDLVYLYNLANVLLYPSLKEGFGFSILEAMACGRPVLVSQGTSLEEITGNLGVLVDPKNTEDIAQKIYEVLFRFHPSLHGGSEELRRQAEKFTWRRTAQLTLAAYEELLVGFRKVQP